MGKKPMTVTEMARMGGRARAAKYTREQLAKFSKNAGRPREVGWQGAEEAEAIARGRQEPGRVRRRTRRLDPHHRPDSRENAGWFQLAASTPRVLEGAALNGGR